MVKHKTVLNRDIFSWTVPGAYWYSHEWLWEVIVYTIYSKFGFTGLFMLGILQVFLILLLGLVLFENILPYAGFLLGLLTYALEGYITARPHITGLLMLISMLVFFFKVKNKKFKLLYMFILFLFWANMHSSVVLGVGVLALLTFLEGKFKEERFWTPVIAFTGSLFNPHFVGLYFYFAKTISSPDYIGYIDEWQSPNFHDKTLLFFTIFTVMFFLFAFSIKRDIKATVWFTLGMIVFLTSERNIALFSTFTAVSIKDAVLHDEKVLKRFLPFVISILLLPHITISLPDEKFFKSSVESIMPKEIIDFMITQGHVDRVFNAYHYGGYLIFRGIKCAIDSRADVYYFNNKNFWNNYMRSTLLLEGQKPEDILFKTKAKYVLFPTNSGYIKYLKAKRTGKVLYQDKEATLLELKGSLN